MPARVAWVGVGVMGRHMVRHLMKAGHEATLFSWTPSKCAALVDAGAKLATSPKQAAQGADIRHGARVSPKHVAAIQMHAPTISNTQAGLSTHISYIYSI